MGIEKRQASPQGRFYSIKLTDEQWSRLRDMLCDRADMKDIAMVLPFGTGHPSHLQELAELGSRVLELLCGSHVTPRTDAETLNHIVDAIESLGLPEGKGKVQP